MNESTFWHYCRTLQNGVTTICLNPYHFEKYDDNELPSFQPHSCEARLCIRSTGMSYICPICRMPQSSSVSNPIIVVKQEVPDEEDEMISDVNKEFETAIEQIEEKILTDTQVRQDPLSNVEVQLGDESVIVIKQEPGTEDDDEVIGEKRKREENEAGNLAKKPKCERPFIVQNVNPGEKNHKSEFP